jgi:hypothetical protein
MLRHSNDKEEEEEEDVLDRNRIGNENGYEVDVNGPGLPFHNVDEEINAIQMHMKTNFNLGRMDMLKLRNL